MNKTIILALFGKSGSGKDSGTRYLSDNLGFHKIILSTSRPKRDNEIQDCDYHFKDKETIEEDIKQGRIFNVEKFNNWYYAIENKEIIPNQINVGAFSLNSLIDIMEDYNSEDLVIIPLYVFVPAKDRLIRTLMREENPDCFEICRRFCADDINFKDIPFECTIIPNNDTSEKYYKYLTKTVQSLLENYHIYMKE